MVNIYKHAFTFGTTRGSNPGPFYPKSDTLTTTPTPAPLYFIIADVLVGHIGYFDLRSRDP